MSGEDEEGITGWRFFVEVDARTWGVSAEFGGLGEMEVSLTDVEDLWRRLSFFICFECSSLDRVWRDLKSICWWLSEEE